MSPTSCVVVMLELWFHVLVILRRHILENLNSYSAFTFLIENLSSYLSNYNILLSPSMYSILEIRVVIHRVIHPSFCTTPKSRRDPGKFMPNQRIATWKLLRRRDKAGLQRR